MTVTRHSPTVESHIKVPIHSKFYYWVQEQVKDKTVLDAGCGQGYGVMILAESNSRVIGIDSDPTIVARAQETYDLPNVQFKVMNCEHLSFASDSFDVVVSNALLEYLKDVSAFFAEAHRVLKPGGLFICGTKNLVLSLKNADGTPRYRNHRQEYSPEDLILEMDNYFQDVRLYGEQMASRSEAYIMNSHALTIEDTLVRLNLKHIFPKRLRRWVRERITGVELEEIAHDDFEIVEHNLEESLYIIGTGVKAMRPPIRLDSSLGEDSTASASHG